MVENISKPIFLAFTGPEITQPDAVLGISTGYECWNLKKFTIDSFIAALQQQIPPLNDNVLRNYRASDSDLNPDFGVRQQDYEKCSWGVMIPESAPESFSAYGETLFLLNLYSPHFLYPAFYATDFGILRPRQQKDPMLFFHQQKEAGRFSKAAFTEFYRTLVSESVFAAWQADRVARWRQEDWRLFTACALFSGLHQYENSKQVFGWQRESTDLATILEALFTAEGDDNTEIGYKLRKRIAVLLSSQIPDIEKNVRELYRQRSAFVHGSFFRHVHKETRITDGLAELPSPPFEFLYRQKEHVRLALISYLHLSKVLRADPSSFPGCDNVLRILETAIIDTNLRSRIEKHTAHILGLL